MLFTKLRARFVLILSPFLLAAGLPAQQTTSSIHIYTQPPGLAFYVDGQRFLSNATLLWPQGSKHAVTTDITQLGLLQQTQYAFSGMTTNLGPLTYPSTITADPTLTWIQFAFSTQYAVSLNYYNCAAMSAASCAASSPGTIYMNGGAFIQNGQIFVSAGGAVNLQASPNPGWTFAGWNVSPGVQLNGQAFIQTITVNSPVTVYPIFQQARPVSVSITTTPPGLQVLLDRTPTHAPITLDWAIKSTHQLGGITPQYDMYGNLWVFSSWSDGGAFSHSYTVPSAYGSGKLAVNATYVPGVSVMLATNPAGLKLVVDGNQNFASYIFAWAPGSTHTVTAPATQSDAFGNVYEFVSWSNKGAATQQITAVSDPKANRYTANYQQATSINIQSSPSGVSMQVDGQACITPCSVVRTIGSTVNVTAPASSPVSDGVRLDFRAWADGAPATRTLTATAQAQTVVASYKLRYQLQAISNPADGVNWNTTPASPDLFFDAQSWVSVSVNPKPGFQFLNWAGDASGVSKTVGVQMVAPRSVRAELNPVPFIFSGGIQNSAAQTPEDAVAPGSAVAIYGVNLAADHKVSPSGHLAQTLDNVTVRVGSQVLPLFFVSPGQINVQLPSNMPDGRHTLTVQMEGKPDASENFTVTRNAPGLFASMTDKAALAIATHQDGSAISESSPARHGEVIALYGTGLGPYHPSPPDGFPVPSGTKFSLADQAKLVMGKHVANPVWAGAAPTRIGVALVQFKIDDSFPHAASVPIKLRVNNFDSNTVMLPVE